MCVYVYRVMGTKVLVHCKMGISRSAATVSHYVYTLLYEHAQRTLWKPIMDNVYTCKIWAQPAELPWLSV